MCVCGTKAQFIVYNYGSEMGITMDPMGMGPMLVVKDFPFMENLPARTMLWASFVKAAHENYAYNEATRGHWFAATEMFAQMARGRQAFNAIVKALGKKQANPEVRRDSNNYEANSQQYAPKRVAEKTVASKDSSRTTTTTTESFASGL